MAYRRRVAAALRPRVPAALTALLVVGLLLCAAVALFVHEDPRTYTTGSESGGTSDVVTGIEALVMIGLVTAAVGLGWLLAAPVRTGPLRPGRVSSRPTGPGARGWGP